MQFQWVNKYLYGDVLQIINKLTIDFFKHSKTQEIIVPSDSDSFDIIFKSIKINSVFTSLGFLSSTKKNKQTACTMHHTFVVFR